MSLLEIVNRMARNSEITSIRHAAAMLGQKELKKWSTKPVRQRIDALLDIATEEQLQTVLDLVNESLKAEK